jgi:hydroxylamine reductase (hybrid-cluster protein)
MATKERPDLFCYQRHLPWAHPLGWVNDEILKLLVDSFDIKLISSPEEDIVKMLA